MKSRNITGGRKKSESEIRSFLSGEIGNEFPV